MAAATARVAAALSLGAGTALVASGGRASPVYSYVADALVGVFSWLDPEDAHKLTIQLAQAGLLPQQAAASEGASLRTKAWGLDFPNPVRQPTVATLRAASEPLRPLSSPVLPAGRPQRWLRQARGGGGPDAAAGLRLR